MWLSSFSRLRPPSFAESETISHHRLAKWLKKQKWRELHAEYGCLTRCLVAPTTILARWDVYHVPEFLEHCPHQHVTRDRTLNCSLSDGFHVFSSDSFNLLTDSFVLVYVQRLPHATHEVLGSAVHHPGNADEHSRHWMQLFEPMMELSSD